MIFILDDDMERIKRFEEWVGKDNMMYAHDPEEAHTILKENEFKAIFLDHDLGGPYTRGPKGDGIDLAVLMHDEKIHTDVPVVCHSLNREGARSMGNVLEKSHKVVIIKAFLYLYPEYVRALMISGSVNDEE